MKKVVILMILLVLVITLLSNKFSSKNSSQTTPNQKIVVVIAPHHDIAAEYRDDVFGKVAVRTKEIKDVVLLSPNHFFPDQSAIIFSENDWDIHNGYLENDKLLTQQLFGPYLNNENALRADHGIYNMLSVIKKYFPQAKIATALIGEKVSKENLENLAVSLNDFCNNNCLVIASVDFSHYLPAAVSNIHDAFSTKMLASANEDEVFNMETDADQIIYTLFRYAHFRQSNKWVLNSHSNSGEIIDNYDIETTSHITGWFERGVVESPNESFTFVFAKDIDPEETVKGLGERFFYGADVTDTELESKYCLNTTVCIDPISTNVSSITRDDNVITVNLSKDVVVGGIKKEKQLVLYFLPIRMNGEVYEFVRGGEKQLFIEKLFEDVSSYSNLEKDISTGSLLLAL